MLPELDKKKIWALLIALLIAPIQARAQSGESFLETIGFGIAVGTVLGASTLPFYDEPGQNVSNIFLGAALGAVGGIGLAIFTGSSDEGENAALPSSSSYASAEMLLARTDIGTGSESKARRQRVSPRNVSGASIQPAIVWTPVVSLTW